MDSNKLRSGYKVYDGEPPKWAEHRRIDCQRGMIDLLVKELEPGQAYAIRIGKWQHRYSVDERGMHILYDFDVDIQKARTMDVIIPVYPDYENMRMMPLSLTAWDEIKRRIHNKVRYRGWLASISDFFTYLEKAQGWKP